MILSTPLLFVSFAVSPPPATETKSVERLPEGTEYVQTEEPSAILKAWMVRPSLAKATLLSASTMSFEKLFGNRADIVNVVEPLPVTCVICF